MRRPLLLAVLMAAALALVIFSKFQLDSMIKGGAFADKPQDDLKNTVDIGVEQPQSTQASAPIYHAAEHSKTDIMAALVEARQTFRNKEGARAEVSKDPHATPSSIVQAAEKLGTIMTLEKQSPAYKPEFQAFYLECAQDKDVLTVTRVQCFENYSRSKELSAADEEKVLAGMEPVIKKLYLEIKK